MKSGDIIKKLRIENKYTQTKILSGDIVTAFFLYIALYIVVKILYAALPP